MKSIIRILLFLIAINVLSQNAQDNDLYILEFDSNVRSDDVGQLYYYITFKSPDKRFLNDCYKFVIPNQVGFEKFKPFKDFKEEVALDTIAYKGISELEKMDRWEFHNFLSSKKNIFLIQDKKTVKKNLKKVFFVYPLVYKGTEKDQEFLKL